VGNSESREMLGPDVFNTAQDWRLDLKLSEAHTAAFDAYAGNLWRSESGYVSARIDGGELKFTVPSGVFREVLNGFRVSQSAGLDIDDTSVLEAGLAEVLQEGVSELWKEATQRTGKLITSQPSWAQTRLLLGLCRFAPRKKPSKSGRQLRIVEYHLLLRPD
jgi:hypothetical protein